MKLKKKNIRKRSSVIPTARLGRTTKRKLAKHGQHDQRTHSPTGRAAIARERGTGRKPSVASRIGTGAATVAGAGAGALGGAIAGEQEIGRRVLNIFNTKTVPESMRNARAFVSERDSKMISI